MISLFKNNFLLLLLLPFTLYSASLSIPTDQLMSIKENIYRFHFDSAKTGIKQALMGEPDDLALNFYNAFINFMEYSQDVTKTRLEPKIISGVNKTIAIADSLGEIDENNLQAEYYKALALGLKGLYHVVKDEYLSAYWYGADGIELLENVVKKEPGFTDAYLGLGLFHYYLGLMPGLVKFFASILGFHGSREDGLKEIELVANKGKTFKVEARFALGMLNYFVENHPHKALYWFNILKMDYPENPLINLMFGVYYRKVDQFSKSKYYSKKVLDQRRNTRFGSLLHGAYYNYAMCFFVENNLDSALTVFQKVEAVNTKKSTYYYSTIKFWLGYLSDLTGDHRKAIYYYHFVKDNRTTKRWFDYVKNFEHEPLSDNEITMIKLENEIERKIFINTETFLADKTPIVNDFTAREKGRYYLLSGEIDEQSENYTQTMGMFRKARHYFETALMAPMTAEVDFKILALAIKNKDVQSAEDAYDKASKYDERYFQIKLRNLYSALQKLKSEMN